MKYFPDACIVFGTVIRIYLRFAARKPCGKSQSSFVTGLCRLVRVLAATPFRSPCTGKLDYRFSGVLIAVLANHTHRNRWNTRQKAYVTSLSLHSPECLARLNDLRQDFLTMSTSSFWNQELFNLNEPDFWLRASYAQREQITCSCISPSLSRVHCDYISPRELPKMGSHGLRCVDNSRRSEQTAGSVSERLLCFPRGVLRQFSPRNVACWRFDLRPVYPHSVRSSQLYRPMCGSFKKRRQYFRLFLHVFAADSPAVVAVDGDPFSKA
jgi:hypothetical protein